MGQRLQGLDDHKAVNGRNVRELSRPPCGEIAESGSSIMELSGLGASGGFGVAGLLSIWGLGRRCLQV